MKTKWQSPDSDNLFQAILALENIGEARRFFRDLLTPEEIIEFAARWKVAKMLSQKVPYAQIEKKTGMSSTTIARVSKYLKGPMKGYRLLISKLSSHHNLANAG